MAKHKTVKIDKKDSSKHVVYGANPGSFNSQTPAWQFHRRDREHEKWGWDKLSSEEFLNLINSKLCHFESMTWNDILSDVGDKRSGNKHHNIPVSGCSREAQKRLGELNVDDIDEIFSLRLTNLIRLFGVRDGRVLRFLWYDTDHSVYPVEK